LSPGIFRDEYLKKGLHLAKEKEGEASPPMGDMGLKVLFVTSLFFITFGLLYLVAHPSLPPSTLGKRPTIGDGTVDILNPV